MKSCSAILIKPKRANPVTLGATEKLTVPEFVPLLPLVIVIQPTALLADQRQFVPTVLTLTLPDPPATLNDWPETESEYVHPGVRAVGRQAILALARASISAIENGQNVCAVLLFNVVPMMVFAQLG